MSVYRGTPLKLIQHLYEQDKNKVFEVSEYKEKYSRLYKNEIITDIDKETREIRDVDTDYKFLLMKDLGESK